MAATSTAWISLGFWEADNEEAVVAAILHTDQPPEGFAVTQEGDGDNHVSLGTVGEQQYKFMSVSEGRYLAFRLYDPEKETAHDAKQPKRQRREMSALLGESDGSPSSNEGGGPDADGKYHSMADVPLTRTENGFEVVTAAGMRKVRRERKKR